MGETEVKKAATGVTPTDTLPGGIILSPAPSITPSQGSCGISSNVVTCNLNSIAAGGGSATVTITGTVDPSVRGTITNNVSVVENEADCNTADNTFSLNTAVNGSADLSIVNSASPDPVIAGQNLTYTLLVSNSGPSDATNVTVVDTLPPGAVSFVSVSTTQGSCIDNGDISVTCNLGTINPGGSATITIVVQVHAIPFGTSTVITNTAVVSGTEQDPDGGNNTSSADTTVDAPVAIPTFNEWGMIVFMLFAGLGSVFYLRRQKRI